jgi:hypothetical protein
MTETQKLIAQKCDEIKKMVVGKNSSYGNSVFEPIRIFSKCTTVEGIAVQLDHKLSRMLRGDLASEYGETYLETLRDIVGYGILLMIAMEDGKSKNVGPKS